MSGIALNIETYHIFSQRDNSILILLILGYLAISLQAVCFNVVSSRLFQTFNSYRDYYLLKLNSGVRVLYRSSLSFQFLYFERTSSRLFH